MGIVKENIDFKRGRDSKKALGLGIYNPPFTADKINQFEDGNYFITSGNEDSSGWQKDIKYAHVKIQDGNLYMVSSWMDKPLILSKSPFLGNPLLIGRGEPNSLNSWLSLNAIDIFQKY